LEQAKSSCANTEASATGVSSAANVSTSEEDDDSDFFSYSTVTDTPGVPERQQNVQYLDKHPVIK